MDNRDKRCKGDTPEIKLHKINLELCLTFTYQKWNVNLKNIYIYAE